MSEGYRPKLSSQTKKLIEEIKEEIKDEEEFKRLKKKKRSSLNNQDFNLKDFEWRRENQQIDTDWIIRKALKQFEFDDLNEL